MLFEHFQALFAFTFFKDQLKIISVTINCLSIKNLHFNPFLRFLLFLRIYEKF